MDNNNYTNIDTNIEKELIDNNNKKNHCCNCNIFECTGTCLFTFIALLFS